MAVAGPKSRPKGSTGPGGLGGVFGRVGSGSPPRAPAPRVPPMPPSAPAAPPAAPSPESGPGVGTFEVVVGFKILYSPLCAAHCWAAVGLDPGFIFQVPPASVDVVVAVEREARDVIGTYAAAPAVAVIGGLFLLIAPVHVGRPRVVTLTVVGVRIILIGVRVGGAHPGGRVRGVVTPAVAVIGGGAAVVAAAVVGVRVIFGMLNNDAIAASASEFSRSFVFGLRRKLRSSDMLSFQCIWCIGAVYT